MPEKIYRIGAASQLCGLTPHTIRRYEAEGEIRFQRDTAGVRMLTLDDIDKVRAIRLEREQRRSRGR